ncbi:hypothetical protein [Bacillus wiedmannii]|uniref:hypothetical protein n=1 Tax=Bacillus wiedmannii TaxID=1890302 RepID=UPI000BF20BE7|nr:hypothetical protein [Bacillus wiedmannii]PEK56728.1 hypothetical protein CN595_29630 [Bacillus wiedmannii]PEU24071.1 hypothetical protein CN526_21205 [Bacillus wiedmannii]PHB37507.1 hypothetical protein COE82_22970 [Bacillus wiedmannii]PHB60923.1 hypothetical protein COE87_22920 [Bacillus wiedmannii]PHC28868.1 hypothetical protein COF00_04750 [Bacillus wiedmannii]
MQLTKLEMAIVLGAFVQGLGEEAINNNESKLLKQLEDKLDEIVNNSTPNQMKEAGESVVNKFILGLLEEKKPKRLVQFRCISCGHKERYTERQARTKDGLQCKHCKHGGAMINEGIQNQTTEA